LPSQSYPYGWSSRYRLLPLRFPFHYGWSSITIVSTDAPLTVSVSINLVVSYLVV